MIEFKNCPYCGEEIRLLAKKCKHCNEWLEDEHTDFLDKKADAIVVDNEKEIDEDLNQSSEEFEENYSSEAVDINEEKKDNSSVKKNTKISVEVLGDSSNAIEERNSIWYDLMVGNRTSNFVVIFIFAILTIFHLSVPDEERHRQRINWDLEELYKDEFSSLSENEFNSVLEYNEFKKAFFTKLNMGNSFSYSKSWFWSTTKIQNANNVKGKQVSFGVLGMVFTKFEKNEVDLENPNWIAPNTIPSVDLDLDNEYVDNLEEKLVVSRNDGNYYLMRDKESKKYLPAILVMDSQKNEILEVYDFEVNSETQTLVYDERRQKTRLDIEEILDYYVTNDYLYFVGFSSMLKYGIYFGVRLDLKTKNFTIIGYGSDSMSINKRKGELNFEQRQLMNDAEYGYLKEYNMINLSVKLY